MKKIAFVLTAILFSLVSVFGLTACAAPQTFTILSGSENQTFEPLLEAFGKQNNVQVKMVYKGSVDIMNLMGTDEIKQYDAVWPSNSVWISMGDKNHMIKNAQSIMYSPIVFGVRKSVAEGLGLTKEDVSVQDILKLIQDKKFTFMMTSATQSNSGACAYIGFINALLGDPVSISEADLQKPELQSQLKALLSGVNRSSGSSGWLKDLFLKGGYDAMVNYESVMIEANQALVAAGQEPLYLVYPKDGLAVADYPLGLVDRGDANSQAVFNKLTEYLLSADVQKQILALGRRTGGGMAGADPKVFNPDWGIDSAKTLTGIRMPAPDVVLSALQLYQSALKKPSFTVYCLDFSGSMTGEGEEQLKKAMNMLMDQDSAKQYLLQATPGDVSVVIPFSSGVLDELRVDGNDNGKLKELAGRIEAIKPDGQTDIYSPAIEAVNLISKVNTEEYFCAIVLLTDGNSNTGASYRQFEDAYAKLGKDIPLFAIELGDANPEQLKPLADLTRGNVFDSKGDLVSAFKTVKGYN